jgi:DNA-binding MarR family transcriptional regulator
LRRRAGDLPESLAKAGGLGARHVAALVSLGVAGPASVGELARRLDMTVAHASLVVGDLARAELVTREHDPSDRRRVIVSASAGAKPALAEMRARNAGPLVKFLAALSDEEAEAFIAHLGALVAFLNAPDEKSPPLRRSRGS